MSDFEKLVNKTIKKVELNADDTILLFTTSDNEKIAYYAQGDCCSISWFAHITNLEALLSNKVNSVTQREEISDIEQKKAENEGNYEVLELYAFDIKTDRGTCEIEFRNDSNGYYGGWCELTTVSEKENLRPITKDF